jgi:malonate decarboxylase delta subunit
MRSREVNGKAAMEDISLNYKARVRAAGARRMAIVGVVASGNLEVLAERVLPDDECLFEIRTPSQGFGEMWDAVAADFIDRYSPGGIRFSINDGGARPDAVSLRLAQAARAMQEESR